MITVGFTGTRRGMSEEQCAVVSRLLAEHRPDEFHLGDCLGADAQAYDIATLLRLVTVGHPPLRIEMRAWCKYTRTLPPRPYLGRNEDIVDACTWLIAAPGEMFEERRSGTWHTIRYARAKNKAVATAWPDGTLT
jgi:hypothetical protein